MAPARTFGGNMTRTFVHTGEAQTWTVPAGLTEAKYEIHAAQGAAVPICPMPGRHHTAPRVQTDHAESRAGASLVREAIANSHPIRQVAVHNLDTRGRLPPPAAPVRGRRRRPARTAIRGTRVGLHPLSPPSLTRTGRLPRYSGRTMMPSLR